MSNIVPEQNRPHVVIDEFSIYRGDQPLHYRQNVDGEVPVGRGDDHAAIMVRLDVDGGHDLVIADLEHSPDILVLRRAIDTLTQVHDQLVRMCPEGSGGRCMASGEWGRCRLREGHGVDVDHNFPTEEEWRAEQEVLHGRTFPKSA